MGTGSAPIHSANYTEDSIKRLTGAEPFVDGRAMLGLSILDYWQWAYSDLIRNTQRGPLAEFIVKAALDAGGIGSNLPMRLAFEPYDLLGPFIAHPQNGGPGRFARIEVRSAAYIQAWQRRHPEKEQRISFRIAQAAVPDETGDYPRDATRQRNADLYVFCLFTPPSEQRDANILDVNLWRFWVAKTSTVNEVCGAGQTVSLKSKRFAAIITHERPLLFGELCGEIVKAYQSL